MTEVRTPIEAAHHKLVVYLHTTKTYREFKDVTESQVEQWGWKIEAGRGFTAYDKDKMMVFAPGEVRRMEVTKYVE